MTFVAATEDAEAVTTADRPLTDEALGAEVRRLGEELAAIRSRQGAIASLTKALHDEERALEEREWSVKSAMRRLTEGEPPNRYMGAILDARDFIRVSGR